MSLSAWKRRAVASRGWLWVTRAPGPGCSCVPIALAPAVSRRPHSPGLREGASPRTQGRCWPSGAEWGRGPWPAEHRRGHSGRPRPAEGRTGVSTRPRPAPSALLRGGHRAASTQERDAAPTGGAHRRGDGSGWQTQHLLPRRRPLLPPRPLGSSPSGHRGQHLGDEAAPHSRSGHLRRPGPRGLEAPPTLPGQSLRAGATALPTLTGAPTPHPPSGSFLSRVPTAEPPAYIGAISPPLTITSFEFLPPEAVTV